MGAMHEKRPLLCGRCSLVLRVGFEPTKAEPIDLQSIVFDHFTISASYQPSYFTSYLLNLPASMETELRFDNCTQGIKNFLPFSTYINSKSKSLSAYFLIE